MERHAVVIGGSVAGLASAIALARRGWRATVVERDDAPDTNDGDAAFLEWDRRNVPQFRQPHAFSARSRNLLMAYIPEVVDWMLADGIDEVNVFKLLASPEQWGDEDEAYTGFWSRRPAFELALRRTAETERGVTILAPAAVDGLLTAGTARNGEPVEVEGVRLAEGTRLEADVVLDCGGRRSPVPKWLGELGVEVPYDVQDCGAVYHARYYRLQPGSDLSLFGILAVQAELEGMRLIGFPGDHHTCGLAAFVRPDDEELKAMRHDRAWDAVMAAIPRVAPWVDPGNGAPLTSVQSMGGHQNIRRRYVLEGRPLAHRLLTVGDSLCTTNPMYGWGASLALTYAFAAVEATTAHATDVEAASLAYDEAVGPEADAVYRESAAMDRTRGYRWRDEQIPEWDRAEVERQELIACVALGALRDPVLGRAQLRRMNLLEPPSAVLDDPVVIEHAKHTQAILAAKALRSGGPARAELVDILTAAVARG